MSRIELRPALLLALSAAGQIWIAAADAPTVDEPAHLAAGIVYWRQGEFGVYNVNPPLPRLLAALPVLLVNPDLELPRTQYVPGSRDEFGLGRAMIKRYGHQAFWWTTLARWACIPFSLLGGWIVYLWTRELYGQAAAFLALFLWCVSPSVLAYGALIMCDMAGAALAVTAAYAFWHWLKRPGAETTVTAGLTLGLAELAKFTNLVLIPVLAVAWFFWHATEARKQWARTGAQLAGIFLLALFVVNLGYLFAGSFTRLGEFRFVSEMFGGPKEARNGEKTGNRFRGTWLAQVPVPLPGHFVQGIDVQRLDFESNRISYLRGEFRTRGWWYYYLYAFLVKVPVGTLLLGALALVLCIRYGRPIGLRNEIYLLLPPAAYLAFVSSQTGFNQHFRYVLPVFPFLFVWIGRLGRWFSREVPAEGASRWVRRMVQAAVVLLGACSLCSSAWVFPHSLSYFNALAGGPLKGPNHLLDSNIDWGQDLTYLKRWADRNPQARPLRLAYFGLFDAKHVYPELLPMEGSEPRPGWYAASVNYVYGYGMAGKHPRLHCTWLRQLEPIAYAGYSIYIYHVTLRQANELRRNVGLPPLSNENRQPQAEAIDTEEGIAGRTEPGGVR